MEGIEELEREEGSKTKSIVTAIPAQSGIQEDYGKC